MAVPSTQDEAELFHKYYVQTRTTHESAKKLLLQLSLWDKSNGLKVLDLGCGTGNLTSVLAEMIGSKGQVIGVDPDKERIEVARQNYKFPNLTFAEGDSATFPEDQYDLIFCHYVTDSIKDKESLYKRVYQNLKSGGQFAIVAIIQPAQVSCEMNELMEAKDKQRFAERFFHCPVQTYDKLATEYGYIVSLKEEDIDALIFPDIETTTHLWKGITHGIFDPEKVDQKALKEFKQKYKGPNTEWNIPVVHYILTKNQEQV